MRRRLIFVCMLFCVSKIDMAQAPCNSTALLMANAVASKDPSADGYIHITYDLGVADVSTPSPHSVNGDPAPSQQEVQAVAAATDQWNKYKDTTGVVFEKATSGPVDVRFSLNSDPAENGGCIATAPVLGDVNFGDTFVMLARSNIIVATTALEHEIGHLLGLNDTYLTSSIMAHSAGPLS